LTLEDLFGWKNSRLDKIDLTFIKTLTF
jgi:hypothetical protein